MALFKVPERAGRAVDKSIAKKANSKSAKSSIVIKGGGGLVERINSIRAMVEKHLGKYRDEYLVIQDEATLEKYIDHCIKNNIISIDTETMGLDPLQDEIVGISIYTPDEKAAYIPVNHRSYITHDKVDGQLSPEAIKKQFDRLTNINVVMFNAAFDIRVIRKWIGSYLTCTWESYLGARLLNENEQTNALKPLHKKYVLNGQEDAFKFDDLFEGVTFDLIPIQTAYLYAAHDAIITYELYEFQKPYLTIDDPVCIDHELQDVAWVFRNIEMPCVAVVVDMEDTGVAFDMQYNRELKDKYHKLLDERLDDFHKACDMYSAEIGAYRRKMGPACKLESPVNINSVPQLATLLYDIVGCELYYDKKQKKETRSTSDDALSKMDNPIAKAIKGYREFSVLVSTFIDKLPDCVNPDDGRIHCSFNQYGADTGRFSSSNPNLQNIPSHNKDIRKMFTASDGYVLMSSDYSQQEPRCMAALCRKAGDSQMYDTFMAGRDLYSEIASKAFNKPYEECKEFRPDGTVNKEGKERRSQAKSILLGINYGRGVDSIAEQLGTTKQKAQEIKDSVFRGFPAIKKFEEDSIWMSQNYGFVTTVCGRKRRLPSMMLPDYEVVWKNGAPPDDDPLDFGSDDALPFDNGSEKPVPEDVQKKWLKKVRNAPFMQKRKVFEAANEEGLWILDHTKEKDTTKVVNARIQGSAADLTKLAMIKLYSDQRLKELGFRMLIPVHDEIIAECPEENAKECSTLLASIMSSAAEQILEMPIGCDVEVTKQWYGESIDL